MAKWRPSTYTSQQPRDTLTDTECALEICLCTVQSLKERDWLLTICLSCYLLEFPPLPASACPWRQKRDRNQKRLSVRSSDISDICQIICPISNFILNTQQRQCRSENINQGSRQCHANGKYQIIHPGEDWTLLYRDARQFRSSKTCGHLVPSIFSSEREGDL